MKLEHADQVIGELMARGSGGDDEKENSSGAERKEVDVGITPRTARTRLLGVLGEAGV